MIFHLMDLNYAYLNLYTGSSGGDSGWGAPCAHPLKKVKEWERERERRKYIQEGATADAGETAISTQSYRSCYTLLHVIPLSTSKMTFVNYHTQLWVLQAYYHSVPLCMSNWICFCLKTKLYWYFYIIYN